MPLATTQIIARIEDLTEYWITQFEENKNQLGLEFIGAYDDPITTGYPAVQIGSGSTTKEVHGTHTFLMDWLVDMYILHAQASETHRTRSKNMLELVTKIVKFLETDLSLGGKIIFGYVINERAGVIAPGSTPGIFVVSTQITYRATAEVRF